MVRGYAKLPAKRRGTPGGQSMHHYLAGSGIRLTYLQDHRALAGLDWPMILEDLIDAGAPSNACRWSDLGGLTHVVLATDRTSGGHVGMLGLIERTTSIEPWLLIEAATVRPGETGVTLLRSMLAHVLARIVCLDGKPAALAAHAGARSIEPALRDLGFNIRQSELYPPTDGNVIVFKTASLARRIGTGGTLVDLRPAAEGSLLRDLRDMHGGRPDRLKIRRIRVKPAKSGTATRRPKKATRTGRNG
jgi:hypothetical protein